MALLVVAAHGAGALGLHLQVRSTAGLHVARDQRFEAGAQALWTAGGLVELVSDIGLGGGLTLCFESAAPSPVVDYLSYRGYLGARLGVFAVFWLDGEPVDAGVRLGVTGAFLRYFPTYTYFVTPGVWLEPALAVALPTVPWLRFEAALPLLAAWRADLALSLEVSLALSVGVTLPPGRQP